LHLEHRQPGEQAACRRVVITMSIAIMRRAAFQRRGAPTCRVAGFTMTELMVTVAIAAILTSVAVPAFSTLIASQRAKTFSSALYATLAKTRSEAITLNGNVTLNPAAGGWGNGWQM